MLGLVVNAWMLLRGTISAPLLQLGSEACRTHVILGPEDTASGLLLEQAEARVSSS